jgi:hypothetical protein
MVSPARRAVSAALGETLAPIVLGHHAPQQVCHPGGADEKRPRQPSSEPVNRPSWLGSVEARRIAANIANIRLWHAASCPRPSRRNIWWAAVGGVIAPLEGINELAHPQERSHATIGSSQQCNALNEHCRTQLALRNAERGRYFVAMSYHFGCERVRLARAGDFGDSHGL